MNCSVQQRAEKAAEYILRTGATVRACAKAFGVSKTTIHKDVTQRLKEQNRALYARVRSVLDENKRQRHIRGGLATREKYRALRGNRKEGN